MSDTPRNSQRQVTPPDLRRAGVAFFRELGGWAFDVFDELNGLCFDSRLKPRPIVWGLTAHGKALGHYSPRAGLITLHTSLIRPSGNPWRPPSLPRDRL